VIVSTEMQVKKTFLQYGALRKQEYIKKNYEKVAEIFFCHFLTKSILSALTNERVNKMLFLFRETETKQMANLNEKASFGSLPQKSSFKKMKQGDQMSFFEKSPKTSKKSTTVTVEERGPKMTPLSNLKKLPKVYNYPMSVKLPNLVTLKRCKKGFKKKILTYLVLKGIEL
jgi:hypothetical protein